MTKQPASTQTDLELRQAIRKIAGVTWNPYRPDGAMGAVIRVHEDELVDLISAREQSLIKAFEEAVYSSRNEHEIRDKLAEIRKEFGI